MDIGLLNAYLPMDRRQALAMGRSLLDRTDGSVLLADIAGFTPLADSLVAALGPERGAEELTRLLNTVYDTLVAQVHRFGGSVVSFVGDALICWFERDRGLRAVSCERATACERATSCALAMQRAMEAYATLEMPNGEAVSFSMKAGVAWGPVRRFLVGDPEVQRLDVLAGMALERMAQAEQLAQRGEVVVGPEAALQLGRRLEVAEWREGYGVAEGLVGDVPLAPWPELDAEALTADQARPYLLPPVYQRLIAGHGEFLAELRPAVMLFLGFSGLDYEADAGHRGDEAGPRLDAYVRWVQGVLARYDGYLLQLTVGDKGSFMYAAFGALAAHEDDAVRAVAAALELQRLPPDLDFISGVRIGVSQGRVRTGAYGSGSRRTYGVIGNEVNIACRLMEAAPAGEVRCSQRIHRAAGGRWRFEGLLPVQVKGRAEPLQVYRPLGQRRTRGLITGGTLVGRQVEVEVLARVLAEATAGQRRVLFLEGEAGIGKSRLVAELARLVGERDVAWLLGAGQSIEQRTPYRAWRDLLSACFGLDDQMELADRQRRVGEWVRNANPSLVERTPLLNDILRLDLPETDLTRGFDPKLRHESLTALVIDLLRAAVAKAPLVLVLEDAHWLDSLSWGLVLSVARALYDRSLLVVVALRPLAEPQPSEYPALAGLEGAETLRLEAMPLDETVALAAARLGLTPEALPAEVADLVRERAGGNPFFAEELAYALHGSGAIVVKEGICAVAVDPSLGPGQALDSLRQSIPGSVEGVILSRIDRLSPEEQLTLKVAAVIGRSFLYRTLSDVHPQQVVKDLLHVYLDGLARRDLTPLEALEPELSYLFKHIITQQVAYDTLLFSQRRELHRSVAGWYEQAYAETLGSYYPLLVHHWHQAEEEERERHYARLAGEQAAAQFATADAVVYFSRALELTPQNEHVERFDLLLAREKMYRRLGQRYLDEQDLAALEDLVEGLDDNLKRAEVILCRSSLAIETSDYPAALSAAQGAIQLLQEDQSLAQTDQAPRLEATGFLLWGSALWRQGDYEAAQTYLRQGLALTRQAGCRQEEAIILLYLGNICFNQGHYAKAQSYYEQSLRIQRALGQREGEGILLGNLGNILGNQGDHTKARVYMEQALDIAQEIGDRRTESNMLNNLAALMGLQGEYPLSKGYSERAMTICHETGERQGEGMACYGLGETCHNLGNYAEAKAYYERGLGVFRTLGDRRFEGWILSALGNVHRTVGDYVAAGLCHQRALQILREIGDRQGESYALNSLGLLYHHLDDDKAAELHLTAALGITEELGDLHNQGYALTYLGHVRAALGRLSEAGDSYRQALALRHEVGQTNLAMEVLAGLARISLGQGDLLRAQTHAQEILDYLETQSLDGTDEPMAVYLTCYHVLQANQDPRAQEILTTAHGLLQERAVKIGDEELCRSFLEKVATHREIITAYQVMESGQQK